MPSTRSVRTCSRLEQAPPAADSNKLRLLWAHARNVLPAKPGTVSSYATAPGDRFCRKSPFVAWHQNSVAAMVSGTANGPNES
ncbi:hypothetical protein BWO90_04510 (plasmid) [Sinorhizobium meliloti]|nr:hypothetical protein BWO90_04510 [Sinorhizobium meliloti]